MWQHFGIEHEKLKAENAYRAGPLAFAALEAMLIRLERFLLGGGAYKAAFDSLRDEISLLLKEFENPTPPPPGLSLAVWKASPKYAAAPRVGGRAAQSLASPRRSTGKAGDVSVQARILAGYEHLLKHLTRKDLSTVLELIDGAKPTDASTVEPVELHLRGCCTYISKNEYRTPISLRHCSSGTRRRASRGQSMIECITGQQR